MNRRLHEQFSAATIHRLPRLCCCRGLNPQICQEAFLSLMEVVQVVDSALLESAREEASQRILDPDDWPALVLSLQLECAIWTEDQDFFGTGVATWTTATVERYLKS